MFRGTPVAEPSIDHDGGAASDTENVARSLASRIRRSEFINKRQTTNLIGAFKFAEAIGLPLSVSVDIAWIFFGGTADDRTRFSRLQQRLSKWARRKCFPLTMIWTREIGKNGSPHTHVLLHVPPQLIRDGSFQRALERSLEPEGSPIHNNAILIQQAYRPLGKLLYNLKGVNPKHANDLRIRPAYQGMLSGKRAGCTQNLSAGARYKATTGEVARASSVTPADTLSVTAGNSDIQVQEGRPSASKFSSGDAQSVARGRKLNGAGSKLLRKDKNGPDSCKPELQVPPVEVIAQAIKIYEADKHGRWHVENYLPSGRRRQESFDISHAEVLRLLRSLWPGYISDQIRIARVADRRFGGDVNRVTPCWQSRLKAALDREAEARRAYSGRREKWEQKQRERERLRRERMPFEQRRELEGKEHDARMKAISAELDEREKAGAARTLMAIRSHIRRGRISHVQPLLQGIARTGSEGVTAEDISRIIAPQGAHLLLPEQRGRWGREIAEALVAGGLVVGVVPDRFVLQEYAVESAVDHLAPVESPS
jgi:hypothetical protein